MRLKTHDGIGLQSMVWRFERCKARLRAREHNHAAIGFARSWDASAEARRGEARANVASQVNERPLLADAIAELESTLAAYFRQRADVSSSTEAVVHSLQESVADDANRLVKVFEELAHTGALLADRIETERDERHALVDAVSLLAGRVLEPTPAIETRVTEPRLVGGTVEAWPPGSRGGEIVLFDDMADSRARSDSPQAAFGRQDDVIERVSELERAVEELRHVDTGGAGASGAAPGIAASAMTPARAVDLTAAMHPQESPPHRWHRVAPSGGGQGAALPVRVVFMLPPDD